MLKSTSKAAFALLTSLLLNGCSTEAPEASATNVLAANDFENLDGWLADSPALATLNQAKAHSGRYSTMVSAGHDYSLGYNNTLGRLSPEWPAKLTVGAWVLLPNDQAAAKLVVEIKGTDPAAPSLVYQAIELPKAVKLSNKWQYVEQTIAMSGTAKPDSKLLVYLWRADSKEPVYLDDLKISLAK